MKKTFTGWIRKNSTMGVGEVLYTGEGEEIGLPTIYKFKGKKDYWFENEWPPIKVKVTVETVEK